MAISGISSALSAIQRQTLALDTAAGNVARAGLPTNESAPNEAGDEGVAGSDGLAQGMVDVLVATRMLSAAFKLAQTTNENLLAGLRAGGYFPEHA